MAERSSSPAVAGLRMADRCPYHRVLTDDFDGCAAFQPAEYIGVDLQFRATLPVWTCRYLEVGSADDGEYYPACGLGGSAQREAWAARLRAERLELFRELQLALSEVIRAHVMELVEAKARRLERQDPLSPEHDGEVTELVRLAMIDVDPVLDRRRRELRRLGVPAAVCRDLIEGILLRLGRGTDFSFPALQPEQLAGMPADVTELLLAFRG